jgi:hypothetical protein
MNGTPGKSSSEWRQVKGDSNDKLQSRQSYATSSSKKDSSLMNANGMPKIEGGFEHRRVKTEEKFSTSADADRDAGGEHSKEGPVSVNVQSRAPPSLQSRSQILEEPNTATADAFDWLGGRQYHPLEIDTKTEIRYRNSPTQQVRTALSQFPLRETLLDDFH